MSTERPNILFIIADQFRNSALGFRGQDPTYTPSLNSLASESKDILHAVSNYPVCSPHRAMLMTGQHPHRNGVPVNINSNTGAGLKPDIGTWANVLDEAGYRTGYIGKWHLEAVTEEDAIWGEGFREGAVWDAYSPMDRRHGFSYWYSYGAAHDHMHPHYWVGDAPREKKITVDQWSVEHETDVALRFLQERETISGPFALVVSYNPPHQPFELAPPTYRSRYTHLSARELLNRPNVDFKDSAAAEAVQAAPLYFAAISALDEQIGRLLAALKDGGQDENTIVIFTSDHGMQLGSHGLMFKNVPWEESMSLPFLIRWPERIAPGADDKLLISSVDVGPTLIGLAGLSSQPKSAMQGTDFSSRLTSRTSEPVSGPAIYYGPPAQDGRPGTRGLRTLSRKLLIRCDADPAHPSGFVLSSQLYDLRSDPYEMEDLAPSRQADVQAMGRELLEQMEMVGDPWAAKDRLRDLLTGE
ncbi:sulfatase [Pseudarthrobacter sp. AL07]|uniref:sulfatase family protein n=1 Tax=unclassified Pseudarthrobacter TaxID=2647000 RepID=UPI00249CF1F5|nr:MULTISPECIES: sulfatase [unclassified Pseudarthrobacter]MDI3193843.1 sulfatase [Pseudarthrobacter sp. AL20]MDI3207647.1 sulfatase [Pseudarthrobacter sp. AL07]